MSVHGESLSSVTTDTLCITCKNKRKKTPDTSIIRKQPIKKPVNYKGDTYEKTHGSDYLPSETDIRVRNMAK